MRKNNKYLHSMHNYFNFFPFSNDRSSCTFPLYLLALIFFIMLLKANKPLLLISLVFFLFLMWDFQTQDLCFKASKCVRISSTRNQKKHSLPSHHSHHQFHPLSSSPSVSIHQKVCIKGT